MPIIKKDCKNDLHIFNLLLIRNISVLEESADFNNNFNLI